MLFTLKEGFLLFGGVVYVLGVSTMSVRYLLLGVATARADVLPVWCGLALIGGLVGLWVGNAGGWILFGIAWTLVGYALLSETK